MSNANGETGQKLTARYILHYFVCSILQTLINSNKKVSQFKTQSLKPAF